ncbi:anhydro-N-acetylmuramic acid kinase [Marinoscillum sp.]|uniref:anhydro-N-acetylmuramic acid kinase n=1 Tax=Marinoscillum sp. TaxID=2024838 RepID=UPI003BA86F78
MTEYYAIGVMSGSSLDGLDVCLCRFTKGQNWSFDLIKGETITIPEEITPQLKQADQLDGLDLALLDIRYGQWIGNQIKAFLMESSFPISVIGVHGHTVFHLPQEYLSVQIGNAEAICVSTQIPTVGGFRGMDVLMGGQGAPLVPFGENQLFPDYSAFVNLGGIANVSVHTEQIRAWDVAPCNQILNHFAKQLGHDFDHGGQLAASGRIDEQWLTYLRGLAYFQLSPPKSLSNQWSAQVLSKAPENPSDGLHTYSHFLAEQLANNLSKVNGKAMITGGGAYNDFLIQLLKEKVAPELEMIIPSTELINFKEALIFAFLGLMRALHLPNVLSSVTGAQKDTVSGILHLPG